MHQNELLRKYFKDQLPVAEAREVEKWLLDPENKETILAMIEEGYLSESDVASVVPFENLWEQIHPVKAKVFLLTEKWFWAACAACILFLLGGMWFGYHLETISGSGRTWQINTSNTGNQFARVTLNDGSEVLLAANSSISFDENTKVNPTIFLDGAAYFQFEGSKNNYTIKTKNLITTTKDSKLNITAFSKDSLVKVIVNEGKAELRENRQSIPFTKIRLINKDTLAQDETVDIVNANEQAIFDKNSKKTNIKKLDANATPLMMLYVNNAGEASVMKFTNASIAEIAKIIQDKYNLDFDITDVIESKEVFSGTFNKDENPFSVLIIACNKMGFTFNMEGNTIKVLRKK